MIYDITRTVSSKSAVWPGDATFTYQHQMRLDAGNAVNLTTITLSPHTGTHADAYYHYVPGGYHPAGMPLTHYMGKARVVHVNKDDGPLAPSDFAHVDMTDVERLLLRSHVSDLPDDQWPQAFPYLSEPLVTWLADKGVVLIGLDSPSVDALDSKDLPCHHALHQAGMLNLELLNLRDVPEGNYELIALPLKLDEICGSPVRAVLRSLNEE